MAVGWRELRLGDVCELKYGKSLPKAKRSGEGFAVFGSNGQVGRHKDALTSGKTIIVGRKGSLGEVTFSYDRCWAIDTTYYIDESATTTDLRWLYYRMRAMPLTLLNRAAAVPGLNRRDAYSQPLLLPPIEEQRRIAAVLDAADELRAKRRTAIAKLDSLTQAIFIDMFGDPVRNPRGWRDDRVLADVAEVRSGITKGRKTGSAPLTSVPYLAVVNVQDGHIQLDPLKLIDATATEIERYAVHRGDILLTEGGDPDKLGRGAVWRGQIEPCIHQNHVFRVRLAADSMTPEFLSHLLASQRGKRYFLRMAKQTTGIASINMTQLRAFPLLEPPRAAQDEFLSTISSVQAARASADRSAEQLDALFASLQQLAFRGEL